MSTYPSVYDHPDNIPIKASSLEVLLGRRLAPVINPDIPLPGKFNIFDEIAWAQALAPVTPTPRQHTWATPPPSQEETTATTTTTTTATATVAIDDYPPPPF